MKYTCGIYKIISPSGKIYIGQSIRIEQRLEKYRKCKIVFQTKIYHSIRKYGFEAHTVEILEVCSKNELNAWEIFYIWWYDSLDPIKGLNIRPGGHAPPDSPVCKPVHCKNKQGITVKFLSTKDCSKSTGISESAINRSIREKRMCKNYYFSHTLEGILDLRASSLGKKQPKSKPIRVKDICGNSVEYKSLMECEKSIGIARQNIKHAAITGKLCKRQYYFSFKIN